MTDPLPDRAEPDRPRPPLPGPRPGDPRPPAQRPLAGVGAAVDAAMADLDAVADRPVAEHVAAFERVHAALGEALADGRPDQAAGQG